MQGSGGHDGSDITKDDSVILSIPSELQLFVCIQAGWIQRSHMPGSGRHDGSDITKDDSVILSIPSELQSFVCIPTRDGCRGLTCQVAVDMMVLTSQKMTL